MADQLTISAAEVSAALKKHVQDFKPTVEREEVGLVTAVGDGIARVSGLPRAMVNEMLEFPGGVIGLAMNLDEHEIGAVVLGEAGHIQEGDPVKQTGDILSVPVGDGMLGRVVDALGEPIDGKGPIKADAQRPLEVQAPGVTARQPVSEPMQSGIKAIDAMTPVGRGQRQLIIGDRQTGKTAVAIDTII
ncbi:MAG: F0F1 ATP synthase subunit alpha, partial [Actinomycetota bacterium]